jgi:polyhydroxyalkanoate synthesis regulator phasin
MGKKSDGLKNFYQMKLREHREEIDELKKQITILSNQIWQLKIAINKEGIGEHDG